MNFPTLRPLLLAFALTTALLAPALRAADLVVLTPETWDEFAPKGKEVDCIYGDIVLRNDKIIAVIASPIAGRNANMTTKDVGGCVIDLTLRAEPNDQLTAYYPCGKVMAWRPAAAIADVRGQGEVRLTFKSEATDKRPAAEVTYSLKDGSQTLVVETRLSAPGGKPMTFRMADEIRADASFTKTPNGKAEWFSAYDPWWEQAYGLVPAENVGIECTSDARLSTIRFATAGNDDGKELLSGGGAPTPATTLVRHLFPGRNGLEVRATAATLRGTALKDYALKVLDSSGKPIAGAEVSIKSANGRHGSGRTRGDGKLAFSLPEGTWEAEIVTPASGTQTVKLNPGELLVGFPVPGRVVAKIVGENGGPIPCKVQFNSGDDEKTQPVFGHQSGEHAVNNLYYSHDGKFEQVIQPGKYEAIVSYGPEYDAVFQEIEIKQGEITNLNATLKRVIFTPGWISSDFHSHSSPSGDNTASQFGRVLNLLAEHIEWAPCTEHNRVSTYVPHLERLGVSHLMGTCSGIELTGSPLPINHQNAFPIEHKPRTQDGGGPTTAPSPSAQIERLALWDNRSEKLVQQNHPDIGKLFFDKDGDGTPDGGFAESLPFMDVIEVHPPHTILLPVDTARRVRNNNTVFNWLQLLNQGHRIPGVVNTDAHYNFHGSGFLRIYFASPTTDDASKAKVLDVVHASEKGHVIMTSGPYLEVSATTQPSGAKAAIPGDDLKAAGGKVALNVKVQCPNWFDIDRVQVFVNGRADEKLNFTRAAKSEGFGDGVVKFNLTIPVELANDAHLIVVAAGEKLTLGRVMGPDHGKDMPIAISNPIYVDADGDGKFTANGDTLGAPLPVAELPAPVKK